MQAVRSCMDADGPFGWSGGLVFQLVFGPEGGGPVPGEFEGTYVSHLDTWV